MSLQKVILNIHIITNGTTLADSYLRMDDSQILETGPMSQYQPQRGEDAVDGAGQYLCAAYIDLHTHGAELFDAMDATPEALDAICTFHLAHGVGAFLPTTLTAPLSQVQKLVDLLKDYQPPVPVEPLGLHMEGPFLSLANRGAQPEEYLLTPTPEAMAFLERNQSWIRLITISPDVPGILPLISWCASHGIVVSGGHDAAIDDQIDAAKGAGMKGVTHICCCSSTISRRPDSPRKHLGLTQLGLLDDDLYVEAIADNCHLPPRLLSLLYRCKGAKNICLVSDSIRAAGMAPGEYMLGDQVTGVPVRVTDEVALLQDQNLFAGSVTPVSTMVRNAVRDAGIPLAAAVAMATENPARVLNLKTMGSVAPGFAPKVNLIDAQGVLRATLCGTQYYHRNRSAD